MPTRNSPKPRKTKAQQPAQPTYESQVVKTQHPSTTEKPDPPSKPKPREWTIHSSKITPHPRQKIQINRNNACNVYRSKRTTHPQQRQRRKQHQCNGWKLRTQELPGKSLTPRFQLHISKTLQACTLTTGP
jgi:hypothetical protein